MGGGLEQFSVSPRPLGFGFGTKGFGAKVLGPGLDNLNIHPCRQTIWMCAVFFVFVQISVLWPAGLAVISVSGLCCVPSHPLYLPSFIVTITSHPS